MEELEAGEMVHSLIDDIPESGSFTSMLDDDQVRSRGKHLVITRIFVEW